MKVILVLLLLISLSVRSQNVTRDSNGNYVTTSAAKAPDIKTKYIYTDSKGMKYPVYLNSKGKPFVYKRSKKTSKIYKMYLITKTK